MQYDLNNIAEKNYDIFENMTEAARPNPGNESSKGLALFKLIKKTLDDEFLNLSVKVNKKLRKLAIEDKEEKRPANILSDTETSLENISPSDTVFADSKEFKKFIKDFIKKVDKLNETDFSKSTPLLPPIEEDSTKPYFNEVWEPPPLSDDFNTTRRIFNGKRSRVKTFPFMASIHLLEVFVCAGSIVSADLILTAASCLQVLYNNRFFRENPRSVFVRIGSDYFSRRGEMIPIFESYFHPSYDPKTLANNLVLIRLLRRISFRKKEGRIKKIKYDKTPQHLSANTDGIYVLGWGSRKRNNIIDQYERIMVSKLEIYQVNECAQIYSPDYVTVKHFCAGFIATGGGACNKDLGGPGIVQGVLVGVISFGAPLCGAIDAPTVFTKVGHYSKWIDSIIEQVGPAIAVRTTIDHAQDFRYFVDPNAPRPDSPYKTTRGYIEPFLVYPDELRRGEQEFKHVVRRRTTPRSQFGQLFPYTPTTRFPIDSPIEFLRSWLYSDYGLETEDVNDMFLTTREMKKAMEHPLINKSLVPIPGVHTIQKKKEKYSTISLTTLQGRGKERSPEITKKPRPHPKTTPVETTEARLIDLLMTDPPVVDTDVTWATPKKTSTTSIEEETVIDEADFVLTESYHEEPGNVTETPAPEFIYYSEENRTLRIKDDYYI
ncbi:hypothetical protein PYW07_009304 [Mythimna separata]|uniref:Peptidase S1 domain-containing protein n=1 Tax=Mythimna separata TaxID=271217 RepID=A0AAD8DM80_MYTSE|nr:hypothetical protein PYW07_009304 [Mythimna separata]